MNSLRREFAYREYHRAILSLKKGIMEKRIDLRTRILACILFACFESYHGNNDEAASQIVAGIEMIGEYLKIRAAAQRSQDTYSYPPMDNAIFMIFAIMEVQAMSYGAKKR